MWQLDSGQQAAMHGFFRWELPLLGLVFAVLLPAFWAYRIADESTLVVTHDTEFLLRVLGLSRQVAVVGMAGTALIFLLGAIQLRVFGGATALEASKLEILGLLTAVLFGVFSYFLIQRILEPVAAVASLQGAIPPSSAPFPLTQKIVVCCLAVSISVTGLFAALSVNWAERFAEERSEHRLSGVLREMADESSTRRLPDAAAWRAFLREHVLPGGIDTVAVMDGFGRLLATSPEHPRGLDSSILKSDEMRERLGRLGNASLVLRVGTVRVVSSLPLANERRLVGFSGPQEIEIREKLVSVGVVGLEALVLSIALAAVAGRGITRSVTALERRTESMASGSRESSPSAPTDDELGRLSWSFDRMQDQIRSSEEQLVQSERRAATAELLAGVAHEVRNPLFGITSTLAALEGELPPDDRFHRYFEILRKEGDRLARMMEEMLSLQRTPRSNRGEVSLLPLLQSCAEWARASFPGKAIQVEVHCPEDIVLPRADEEGLRSLFTNLVENSILSSDRPVRVRLFAERTAAGVQVRVEDDGPGIDSRLRGRMFEAFVSGRAGGTGMGLAICRQIAHEHGGSISARALETQGAEFTVDLPDPIAPQSFKN
jgi:signal transduction histidine kinase